MDKLRKIRGHHWKERRKISKSAKFESDLLKTNEDINSSSKSRNFNGRLTVGGTNLPPPHTNVCRFSQLYRATSSLAKDVSLSKLAILLI